MECNKEEAIRAKDMADSKMQCGDFVGARKLVFKAQQLFPDLENILQMLTVCEVHCSAEAKVNGSEDWYGILQVEPTADDSLIKKQYKKLAFLLHPDKNKFAGAEAAFKLVGEAHRTLTDQTKRSVYDLKRCASIKTVGPKPPHHPRTSSTRKQPAVPNSYTNHAATPFANLNQTWDTQQTFWTVCPSCGIRYQYYRAIINKPLRCQNCLKPFIAYDISARDVPTGMNSGYPLNQSGIHQHKGSEVQKNASQQSNGGSGSSHTNSQKNTGGRPTMPEPVTKVFGHGNRNKMEDSSSVDNGTGGENEVTVEKVKLEKVNKREPVVQSSGNASQKRRRKVGVQSRDTDSSDSEIVFEESQNVAASNIETTGSHYPRRSARQKQNVTYNEDNSDADDFENTTSSKRSRRDGSSHSGDQSGKMSSKNDVAGPTDAANVYESQGTKRSISTEEDLPNGNKQGKNGMKESRDLEGKGVNEDISKDGVGLNPDSGTNKSNSESVPYPDPEFHDFDMDKDSKCFAMGQIWAMYDDLDGMPRFYARITNVSSGGFKVRFSWLEYDPADEAEIEWHDEELPVGCGSFIRGKAENSEDIRMFSHLMSWSKGPNRNSYVIYPRKGEVWALFKGWDTKWRLDPDQHRQYEYEIVEILSDFSVDTGVDVVYLVKVKGFVSLFCRGRKQAGTLHIPPTELLRFSHVVPSYRMTGKEREGIPEGIFELDCASLPTNLEEMFSCVTLDEIRVNVEDAGRGNAVPACISGVRERKYADEFEDLSTFGNNIETNVKIQVEKPLKSSDLSPESLSTAYERKKGQASGSKFATTDAEKIASERMPSEHLVNDKEKHLDAPSTSIRNAMENRNEVMPDPSSPACFEYLDSEFYNFDLESSKEMFETGQIWALYSEDDGFPKYYALVRKVDSGDFKVHVIWLEACPLLQEEIEWSNNDLPFGCGRFRLCGRQGRQTYDNVQTFSHLIRALHVEKQQYDIYPQVNEVWAVFMNWSAEWKLTDLENCVEKGEYEVVEITDCSDSVITVNVLEKVDGFRAVFRPKRNNGSLTTMEVFRNQFLKFSHRIPSFRLTEQRGGKLRDCWELDPASVPDILLCTGID